MDRFLTWNEWYEKAVEYFKQHGNLEVPQKYKTNDGYSLGIWIANQRRICIPETDRGQLLLKIGMRFKVRKKSKKTWDEMYENAKEYFNEYGDLEVPRSFKAADGSNLGKWVADQRQNCSLKSVRGQLLLRIGMRFRDNIEFSSYHELGELKWLKMYAYAVTYYEQNGNLKVSQQFKTNDGLNLGRWIDRQRKYYSENSLSFERISMLNSIGMVWDIKQNRYYNLILCDKYEIDVDKNSKILKCISCIELNVKLSYLKNNKMNIVDENGFLHEIFSMSSVDMKLKYGVCLKDLIELYNKEFTR